MATIHPTAVIDRQVELADDVRVGPYVIIEGAVTLGKGTIIDAHSIIRGHTVVGAGCRIGPAAHIGLDPQHLGFDASLTTSLVIGEGTIIRESASIHRGMKPGIQNATRIGARCFIMGSAHIGHDCRIADDVIMAQGVHLGGHVEVGQRAFLGGGCVIHQFCKVGRLAVISGNEPVSRDVPPFAAVRYNGIKGYNAIGCRRARISREGIRSIHEAYHCLHTIRTTPAAVEAIERLDTQTPEIREILDFISKAKRGIQPSIWHAGRTPALVDELAE